MVKKKLNFVILLFFLPIFFLFKNVIADENSDQWLDSEITYRDLINEGFEVKAYDMTTIETNKGFKLLMFVTVLQKNNEVYECQEYQTIDDNMNTLDLSLICRQLVQPYQQGVGT